MYVSYAPSSTVKFTLGTWATHIGYEVMDAYLNRNYSMSYMYTHGPFTHTGLKADVGLGGKSAFMIGISNAIDLRTAPGLPKTIIAQFSTGSKDDKLKTYLNFAGGKQNVTKSLHQADIVATYTFSSTLSAGINGTLQALKLTDTITHQSKTNTWSGGALYLNLEPASWVGLAFRIEYISDNDQYLGLKNVIAPTLSANFKIDSLIIIPEFRIDHAGNKIFYRNARQVTQSTASFLIAAVYHF